MPWFLFGWPTFWIVVALVVVYFSFKAGWHAHANEDWRKFMAKIDWPRDEPPGGAHV